MQTSERPKELRVQLDPSLYRRLRLLALNQDRPVAKMVREVLEQWVAYEEAKAGNP